MFAYQYLAMWLGGPKRDLSECCHDTESLGNVARCRLANARSSSLDNSGVQSVTFEIPQCIEDGEYLFRVEHVALHGATEPVRSSFFVPVSSLLAPDFLLNNDLPPSHPLLPVPAPYLSPRRGTNTSGGSGNPALSRGRRHSGRR